MSADLNTEIKITGNSEELYSLIEVIRSFETEKVEQYRANHDCAYLEMVRLSADGIEAYLREFSEKELRSYITNANGEIRIVAGGPYGVFAQLGEVGLFEEMASTSPTAYFKGNMFGFVTGADVTLEGELIDGMLHLTEYYMPNEEMSELYIEAIEKIMSRVNFCSIFKVDEDDFDDDCYYDFISEAIGFDGFPDMDYETFLNYCDASEIDKDEYETAIEKVRHLGLFDEESFEEEFDTAEYSTYTTYDPISKKYVKELFTYDRSCGEQYTCRTEAIKVESDVEDGFDFSDSVTCDFCNRECEEEETVRKRSPDGSICTVCEQCCVDYDLSDWETVEE